MLVVVTLHAFLEARGENCLLFKYTVFLHCHSALHGFDV